MGNQVSDKQRSNQFKRETLLTLLGLGVDLELAFAFAFAFGLAFAFALGSASVLDRVFVWAFTKAFACDFA